MGAANLSARGLARRLVRRLCALLVHRLVHGHSHLPLPPAFPPAPPASPRRSSRPPVTAQPPLRRCAHCPARPPPPSLRCVVARTAAVRAVSVARPLWNPQPLPCLSSADRRRVPAAAAHAAALAAHPCGNARRGCCPGCALAAAATRSDVTAATRRVAATAAVRRSALRHAQPLPLRFDARRRDVVIVADAVTP